MAIHVRHHTRDKLAFRFIGGLFAILLCAVSVGSLSGIYVHRHSHYITKVSVHQIMTAATEPIEPEGSTKPDIPELPPHEPPHTIIADTALDFLTREEIVVDFQPVELAPADDYILFPHVDLSGNAPALQHPASKKSPQKNASTAQTKYTPPQYKKNPHPIYPKELARMRINGHVKVRIHIDTDGKPTGVEIIDSTHPAFAKTTKEKIMSDWYFSPAQSGGSSIAATVITTINFDYSVRK